MSKNSLTPHYDFKKHLLLLSPFEETEAEFQIPLCSGASMWGGGACPQPRASPPSRENDTGAGRLYCRCLAKGRAQLEGRKPRSDMASGQPVSGMAGVQVEAGGSRTLGHHVQRWARS